MNEPQSDPIIANQVKLILKNGHTIQYTHITSLRTFNEMLWIHGEIQHKINGAQIVFDKHFVKDLNYMMVEFPR